MALTSAAVQEQAGKPVAERRGPRLDDGDWLERNCAPSPFRRIARPSMTTFFQLIFPLVPNEELIGRPRMVLRVQLREQRGVAGMNTAQCSSIEARVSDWF
ncbi:hypothetical protein FHX16_002173 [Rhizobium sp. BK661]|nr:hypothetical protein [Rhizobium sp. BK661]MCS3740205.1 hypothetical protein [Rhizobium sp. BK661]